MPAEYYDYGWLNTTQIGTGIPWNGPTFGFSTGNINLGAGLTTNQITSTAGNVFLSGSTTGAPMPLTANIVGVELRISSLPTPASGSGLLAAYAEIVVAGVGLGNLAASNPIGVDIDFGGPAYLGGHPWVPADVTPGTATISWLFATTNTAGVTRFLGIDGVGLRVYTNDSVPASTHLANRGPKRIPAFRSYHGR